jgi:excisionase family DNA binding protein
MPDRRVSPGRPRPDGRRLIDRDPESYLLVEEVSEHLRVTSRTVYHLIEKGAIPARKVGRGWRIRVRDLVAFCGTPLSVTSSNG